jgi:hypothetical protein
MSRLPTIGTLPTEAEHILFNPVILSALLREESAFAFAFVLRRHPERKQANPLILTAMQRRTPTRLAPPMPSQASAARMLPIAAQRRDGGSSGLQATEYQLARGGL